MIMKVNIKSSYFVLIITLYLFISLKYEHVDATVLDDIDIDFLNSDYINMSNFEASIKFKRKSVNTLNLKVELTRDMPDDIYVTGDVSTRAFGYEVPTGLKFRSQLCNSLEGKVLYKVIVIPMGGKECPPKKGLYERHDLEVDFSKLDISLVSGARLQLKLAVFGDGDTAIAKFRVFILT